MLHRRHFLLRAALALSGAVLALPMLLSPHPAAAQAPDSETVQAAERFVRDLGQSAIETLAKPELTEAETEARFRELLTQGFDTPLIGRFVLGRYWNVATSEQRQEYLDLFERLIVDVYADRFSQYSGETLEVTGARPVGGASSDVVVASRILRPAGAPVQVEWRVRPSGDGDLQIIDVIVEGVSMSVTQRSEFASVIQSRGGQVQGLLDALRERVGGA